MKANEAALLEREAPAPFDAEQVRSDFPILFQQVHGRPLAYLDNGATSQKPRAVIDAVSHYYETINSNVHRGVHTLSQRATDAFEAARATVCRFLNAASVKEIVFVRGATEAVNLVANSWGRVHIRAGDEIVITHMEHHANIVPWQLLAEQAGAHIRVVPITDAGELVLEEYHRLIGSERVKLAAFTHVSNALGTVNPVKDMVRAAHARGIVTLVDGAQAVPHCRVDVRDIGCDFYVFSGHKVYGPTGIGVLYGREALLEAMPPWQGGGDMIRRVTFEKSTWNDLPYKFEAGTPDIAGGIGLGAALDYLERVGIEAVAAHEHALLEYATARALEVPGLRVVGTAAQKAGILSFVLEGIHPHDIGTILDHEGVAIRTGHHCAMPVMDRYGIPATARASFAMYNNRADVDALIAAVHRTREIFG